MFQKKLFASPCIRPEISSEFLSKSGPNPTRTWPEPDPKIPAQFTTLTQLVQRLENKM